MGSASVSQHVVYAFPAFVLAFPTIPVFVLLPEFYANSVGLGLSVTGAVFLALRLLDVVSDPVLGWLSDGVPKAWGRRKFPIAIGGLLGAPALIALLSPPEAAGGVYLFVCGTGLYLAWTAIQIPYLAWAAELEQDYQRRNRLNGFREAAGLLGILSVGALGVGIADLPQAHRMQVTAWVTVALGVVAFFVALRFVPEGRQNVRSVPKTWHFPRQNRLFLRLLSAWFLNGLANGLPAVCFPLFLMHILQVGQAELAQFLFLYFLSAVLGIPLWLRLARRMDKHRVWCWSMVLACIVFAYVPAIGPGDKFAFAIVCVFTGAALGSDLALPPSMQADCADWDAYRFHHARLGSLFAYWSMATKLALGCAVGLAYPALEAMGLEAGQPLGVQALVFFYALLPVALKLGAVAMMWRYPLTRRRHAAMQTRLERRS